MDRIPLVDLKKQNLSLKQELMEVFNRCLLEGSFIGGPDHRAFEAEFADFCGGGHVALCANGTDALYLTIIELLGRGKGEEIITVANSFIATSEAISLAGYQPIFVDVDPKTYLMDPAKMEAKISDRTKAIIPVHLYGQMAPMDSIMTIAQRHHLRVIEDAAQAHGAQLYGKMPGIWSDAATFSFYPGKNLGALGDAGAIFSKNADLVSRIRMRANHGRSGKYEHDFEGINSRLDGLQAGFLRVKLRHLPEWTRQRREVAKWYREALANVKGVQVATEQASGIHVYHLFVIEVEDRDRVLNCLISHGIEAGVHYPVPLHEQRAYSHLKLGPEDFPICSTAAKRILSLPLFPEMTRDQVNWVCEKLKAALGGLN